MLLVLCLAAGFWGLGSMMGAPRRSRLNMIAALFGCVLLAQLLLPDGHPIREATGQSPVLWLMLGAFAVVAGFYGRLLGALRMKARDREAPTEAKPAAAFTEAELSRYARHIVLREIGGPGQKKMKQARVLVIGAGGLGAPALQYLAAAGIGTIGIIDDDEVENANLQRQVIHRDADIGVPKVFSAQAAMEAQNPSVTVLPYHRRLEADIAEDLFADFDVILDGTDNFDTRYLANRVAVAAGKPLISGALSQWEGQISVFDPASEGPCYQCIFPEAPDAGLAPSCAEAGVVGPLPGVIGAMMAVETVKIVTGAGAVLRGQMLIYDALYGETRTIRLKPRDGCPICGSAG